MTDSDREQPVVINQDTRFEPTDMSVAIIAAVAVGILLYVTLTPFILTRIYRPALSDVSRVLDIKPPAPALQLNTAADLAKFRAQEEQRLDSYGWVDRGKGLAHIPIAQAMEDVATRGIADFSNPLP
jgi:hypothetical protein